jgi:hypothetical protein
MPIGALAARQGASGGSTWAKKKWRTGGHARRLLRTMGQ